jgi:hypothetical protein
VAVPFRTATFLYRWPKKANSSQPPRPATVIFRPWLSQWCSVRAEFTLALPGHLRFGELKRLGGQGAPGIIVRRRQRSILSQTFDPHGSWRHRCGIEPGHCITQQSRTRLAQLHHSRVPPVKGSGTHKPGWWQPHLIIHIFALRLVIG